MKKIIIIILAILFFMMPFLSVENKSNFQFFIIIWPLIAIIFAIIKIKNFNNSDFKKVNFVLNENKIEDSEKDNLSEKENDVEKNNSK